MAVHLIFACSLDINDRVTSIMFPNFLKNIKAGSVIFYNAAWVDDFSIYEIIEVLNFSFRVVLIRACVCMYLPVLSIVGKTNWVDKIGSR